jgi:hypothetical protein
MIRMSSAKALTPKEFRVNGKAPDQSLSNIEESNRLPEKT